MESLIMIAVPKAEAAKINELLGAFTGPGGQSFVNCTSLPNLPDITLKFAQKEFPLSAQGTQPIYYLLNVLAS